MTPIERQLLKNQSTILMALADLKLDGICLIAIDNRIKEIFNLLNPTTEKETCCEMPEEFVEVSNSECLEDPRINEIEKTMDTIYPNSKIRIHNLRIKGKPIKGNLWLDKSKGEIEHESVSNSEEKK